MGTPYVLMKQQGTTSQLLNAFLLSFMYFVNRLCTRRMHVVHLLCSEPPVLALVSLTFIHASSRGRFRSKDGIQCSTKNINEFHT